MDLNKVLMQKKSDAKPDDGETRMAVLSLDLFAVSIFIDLNCRKRCCPKAVCLSLMFLTGQSSLQG